MLRPYDPISSVTDVLCLCVPSYDINTVQNCAELIMDSKLLSLYA